LGGNLHSHFGGAVSLVRTGAGHFLQGHVPEELVELINDFHTGTTG
jgi:hypothetical protein